MRKSVKKSGKIPVATPAPSPRFTLKVLLSKVTRDNRHEEIRTGDLRGREA